MHLNIPPHDESPAQSWMKNLKWGLIGIFGPELVVFAAWRQYNSAKELHAEVQRHLNEQDQVPLVQKARNTLKDSQACWPESTKPKTSWTMVHSFYAGMGGFIFEMDDYAADGHMPFIPGSRYLTISARGIAFLAKCGHLPSILEDDVVDKSKADGLTKFFVCLQAGWMIVQVVARVALGLSVTLLEVNILGHVLCALIIYILWWHKPRLVHEPTKLKGDWVRPLSAYMYMSSQISGWSSSHAGLLRRTWIDPELSALALFTRQPQGELEDNMNKSFPTDTIGRSLTTAQDSIGVSFGKSDTITSICESESDFDLCHFGIRPQLSCSEDEEKGFIISRTTERAQTPSTMQLNRWRLAADAVRSYSAIRLRFSLKHGIEPRKEECDWFEPVMEELLTRSAGNWPAEDLLRGTGGLVMGMVLWCASMAYGGVHLAAWHDYFPSDVEAWMWRSSSIYITSSGFIWLLINLFAHQSKSIEAYWDKVIALRAHWTSYLILGSLCSICGIVYIFARLFLVTEAFISIRQLPLAAYETPNWTQIIPHF